MFVPFRGGAKRSRAEANLDDASSTSASSVASFGTVDTEPMPEDEDDDDSASQATSVATTVPEQQEVILGLASTPQRRRRRVDAGTPGSAVGRGSVWSGTTVPMPPDTPFASPQRMRPILEDRDDEDDDDVFPFQGGSSGATIAGWRPVREQKCFRRDTQEACEIDEDDECVWNLSYQACLPESVEEEIAYFGTNDERVARALEIAGRGDVTIFGRVQNVLGQVVAKPFEIVMAKITALYAAIVAAISDESTIERSQIRKLGAAFMESMQKISEGDLSGAFQYYRIFLSGVGVNLQNLFEGSKLYAQDSYLKQLGWFGSGAEIWSAYTPVSMASTIANRAIAAPTIFLGTGWMGWTLSSILLVLWVRLCLFAKGVAAEQTADILTPAVDGLVRGLVPGKKKKGVAKGARNMILFLVQSLGSIMVLMGALTSLLSAAAGFLVPFAMYATLGGGTVSMYQLATRKSTWKFLVQSMEKTDAPKWARDMVREMGERVVGPLKKSKSRKKQKKITDFVSRVDAGDVTAGQIRSAVTRLFSVDLSAALAAAPGQAYEFFSGMTSSIVGM